MAALSPELEKARQKIVVYARDYGLDFFDTIFEVITYKQMSQIAAFGGFPVRYPHWRFGMEYESLSKGYEYGLSKIYEMVINTDPCYAYLMEGNAFVDQKLVMAHVFGHCDFFKCNQWFAPTNRKMIDTMANHATRIRRYIDRYGLDTIESFVDTCLSLENLIDRYSPYTSAQKTRAPGDSALGEEERPRRDDFLLPVEREYMDSFINPPDLIKKQREKAQQKESERKFPAKPDRDILKFLIHYAPLSNWQQDVLSIVRDEAYYFAPQGMTKIMNEGWASYWHTTLMVQKILSSSEVIDYADHHSGTVAMSPTSFNPYKVGLELFRNIEERWNKGRFGSDWESCEDVLARKQWDLKLGLGRQKIFEVRRDYNDVTFIDEFLTEDFCIENKMFVYKFNKRTSQYEIDTRDFKAIKRKLLFQLTNWGQPIIRVDDGNYKNRGELLLVHMYEGIDMQPDYMMETLRNLFRIWGRPVHISTVMDGEEKIFTFDGEKDEKDL